MKIKVTQDHRLRGIVQSVAHCPIALAVREQHGVMEDDIDVDKYRILARDRRGRMRRYYLPEEARAWIQTFDFGNQDDREALPEIEFAARRA